MKIQFSLFIIFVCTFSYAQNLISEFGVFTGATSMQTDYGERGHFGSSYANVGFGIGGVYYLSFNNYKIIWHDRTTYLKEHFRLRIELSYMKTNLIHRGKYTQGNTIFTKKYNAMRGTSAIFNYGTQIEYTMFNMSDGKSLNPYLSIGFLGNINTPKLESKLGDIKSSPYLIPTVYNGGVFLNRNNTTSFIVSAGTRINPKNKKATYLIDFRWQRFNSDTVEGLIPRISANKFNDWLLFIHIGYVFRIN